MQCRRHRTITRQFHEQLECRLFLSAVAFASHVITRQTDGAGAVYAADVDGDGDVDVFSASSHDDKIAWYENTDGEGTFGPQQVITTQADAAITVYAADVDGDGDVDVLSASVYDSTIAWHENTDGEGTFGPQQVITTQAAGATQVYAVDVDGDGDVDVLSASHRDDEIAWYENTDGGGTFGLQQVISKVDQARSVHAADVDGDGDMDVLSASRRNDRIAWYENTDGGGTFGPQQVITTQADSAESVYAADVDGDGDVDVLSASLAGKIAWYENTDGTGTFGPQRVITTQADGAISVYAVDVDGDGDVDVLSASVFDDKVAWYENTDGEGAFGLQQVISLAPSVVAPVSVYAADVDGDGDVDVLSASVIDDKVAWFENRVPFDANDDGRFDSLDLARVFQAGEYEDDVPNNSTFDEGDWNGDGDFTTADLVSAFQAGTHEVAARQASAEVVAAVDWLLAEKVPSRQVRAFVA